MALIQSFPQLRSSPFNSPPPPPPHFPARFAFFRCSVASPVTVNVSSDEIALKRNNIRLGLPSKGRMATDTLELLKVPHSLSFHPLFFFFTNYIINMRIISFILLFFWPVVCIGLSIISEAG